MSIYTENSNRAQSGHNLRHQKRKDYTFSMESLPDAITADDETKLNESQNSPERQNWVIAIDEEI